jgi:hypothetical protein
MVVPKREKMACQKSMTQKKEKKVAMSQKKRDRDDLREKTNTSRSKPQPSTSIHPSTHTLAPFDRDCITCFSMDHLFDFTIYGMQVCPVLTLH